MSNVIGIGARPLRKEDRRFLTGRGNYVADIKRPDMVAGVFVRSPHAHANHQVDRCRAAALAMPGVLAVVTGEDLKAAGVGGLPCGWGITGKDGLPMKEPPHPALAQGQSAPRRRSGLRSSLPKRWRRRAPPPRRSPLNMKCFRPWSACLTRSSAMRRCLFDDVPNNLCCDWALGDNAATDAAFRKAAHVARISLVNNRLVGNPMEPRAAIAEYNAATGQYTLWSTSQFPHVVRLLMGAFVLNIPQHKLRVVAPDVGGGFGVKQFHYAEEAVITWTARESRQADQMGVRAQRRFRFRCSGPRSRHRGGTGARRERQIPRACG